ncbi:golgi family SNAP receptor complex member 2 [Angomonas deanei]|uniref:SNARE domain containing protein n=1 Tax=Angomonas deanei TaxID=59799 RepID=A0A7G2CEW0_9TRYP|nr:golgi family SNAP receptor complex member 2 [Angomonas deanei]CAD2217557.1 hypothetical protein, conserved [Angomonas deanei]|eukprot:EPY40497.1 golgi family SNAP receptor complex member 2 [Angomonas deanei]
MRLNDQISLLERGAKVDCGEMKLHIAELLTTLQSLQDGILPVQGEVIPNPNSNRTVNARGEAQKAKLLTDLQLRKAQQMASELHLIETVVSRFERKAQVAQEQHNKRTELLGDGTNRLKTESLNDLEEERKALLYTRKRIQQINGESDGVLQRLKEQGRRLGGVGDNLGSMLESLGVSNSTIGQIVRRNKGDAWIVYCGIALLLLLMWYIW